MLSALRPDPQCKTAREEAVRIRRRVHALARLAPDAPPVEVSVFDIIIGHRRVTYVEST